MIAPAHVVAAYLSTFENANRDICYQQIQNWEFRPADFPPVSTP